MRAQRPQRAASNPRGHRFGAGVVRVLSVAAVAATACAMMAGAASAAPAAGTTPSTTTITNTPDPGVIKVGQSYTFDVTVTPSAATGTVTVAPSETGLPAGYTCTATLTAGTGSCTVTPTEYGVVDYAATYGGDATYAGSASATFPLAVQNVTSTTVAPARALAGPVALTGSVYAMGAKIIDGAGSLAFYRGTTIIAGCAAVPLTKFTTAGDNVGACKTTLGRGTYTINVVYSGDEVNVASKGSKVLTVTRRASRTAASASPNPALVHKSVRLSATVKGLGGTARGTVTFTWRGKVICRRSLSGGSMHCSVKFAKAGTYVLTATYAGNSIYKASARQIRVRIKK
jgi:Bacterial Ig-like domain (group 3)